MQYLSIDEDLLKDVTVGKASQRCFLLVFPALNDMLHNGFFDFIEQITYLFNKSENIFHCTLEGFFIYRMITDRKMTDDCDNILVAEEFDI